MITAYYNVLSQAKENHETPATLSALISLGEEFVLKKGLHANPKRASPSIANSLDTPLEQIQSGIALAWLNYLTYQKNRPTRDLNRLFHFLQA